MVLLTGPRQAGKTTLAKNLNSKLTGSQYLNFESVEDKRIFLDNSWDRKAPLLVLDEIHKWPRWKNHIKGVYDTEGVRPRLLVTGSAKLDLIRKRGDSLAGRYFLHRLHPFSPAELAGRMPAKECVESLMRLGGFPEPFLSGSELAAKRWRKNYLDRLLREDIRDIAQLRDLSSLAVLFEMLRERVGSPISYQSLAEDLHISPITVKLWIEVLETMFLVFRVNPHHRNIARAIRKEPKIYFYDTGLVRGNAGAIFENLVAACLLKHTHFLEDIQADDAGLYYLRDKEKREVDFTVMVNGKARYLIEAKNGDESPHKPLERFGGYFPNAELIQIVHNLRKNRTVSAVSLVSSEWLASLEK